MLACEIAWNLRAGSGTGSPVAGSSSGWSDVSAQPLEVGDPTKCFCLGSFTEHPSFP